MQQGASVQDAIHAAMRNCLSRQMVGAKPSIRLSFRKSGCLSGREADRSTKTCRDFVQQCTHIHTPLSAVHPHTHTSVLFLTEVTRAIHVRRMCLHAFMVTRETRGRQLLECFQKAGDGQAWQQKGRYMKSSAGTGATTAFQRGVPGLPDRLGASGKRMSCYQPLPGLRNPLYALLWSIRIHT